MKTIYKIIVIGFFLLGIIYNFFEKLLNMFKIKTGRKILVPAVIILTIGGSLASCSSTKETYTNATDVNIEEESVMEKSGALLWGETCNRCHLAPSPADYNDTDWGTISLHMGIRANLEAKEIQKIEEFLKSAN